MTHLTSEQYRDVLKHIPDCTTEIPTVQTLLRRAVQTFFKKFGGYPELAGVAPGKVGLFGEQIQFSDGSVLPVATPMATIIVGRRVPGNHFSVVTSADVGKPHKVKFSFSRNRPLDPRYPGWLNYIIGVIDSYPETVPPFEAAIESSIPMGVGYGSAAAVEVATYTFLEVLMGKKVEYVEMARSLQKAEREFVGRNAGLADRIASILAKDRHVMLIDCKTQDVTWKPFRNSKVRLVAVNSHLKDELFGDEYPERTKYIRKACEILGVEDLRNCTEEDLNELEDRVNEILNITGEDSEEETEKSTEEEGKGSQSLAESWTREEYDTMIKRARFFITEMTRMKEAIAAWEEGDVETFGEKLKESHISLKEDFGFSNPVLDFLVETSLEVEGVLGSRMTGMGLGFGGGIISLVDKDNIEKYCRYVTEKFEEYENQLSEEMRDIRQQEKQRQHEVKKKLHSEHYNPLIASSEKIEEVQNYLEAGGVLKKALKRLFTESGKRASVGGNICADRKKNPCIMNMEKPPPDGCGTWPPFQKDREKEEFVRKSSLKKLSLNKLSFNEEVVRKSSLKKSSLKKLSYNEELEKREEEGETSKIDSSKISQVSTVALNNPSFYIISPFAGARMMFVTKSDILRSRYSEPVPHPKALVKSAIKIFETTYGNKVEAIGLAPSTVFLFGQFMEFHLGYIISMTLPMYVVTVGGRNDTVFISFKTTSEGVESPTEVKCPVPCVRPLEMESRSWVNQIMGVVNGFKSHLPGFNAVIHSSAPVKVGLHTCASLQSSIYTFLENLTRDCTEDLLEKVDRCNKSDVEFLPAPTELVSRCTSVKFFPIFLCKEGHLMLINCRNFKISNLFFDDPAYAFLIATCKRNDTGIDTEALDERIKQCMEANDILDKKSLLFLDQKHLRCLKKRGAPEEVIKRARYIITEQQRTTEAIKAIKDADYARVGLLMNQSHASLRDDYEISSPQIEELIKLALSVEGVLGAKILGAGLNASIIILLKLSDADKCIRYMRKNYKDKSDKPVFYITKPAGGAFAMNPTVDVPHIL